MATPEMIKNLIGKEVKASTLTRTYRGEVAEVEGNWVKLVNKTPRGDKVFVVQCDMILGIVVD